MRKSGIKTDRALLTVLLTVAVAVAPMGWPSAVAQDTASPGMENLLVVSLSGYDNLLADVGFLGQLIGQPALAEQLTKTLDMFTQGQGLAGLDKANPWGVVVQTDGMQFQPLAFVPVKDLKQLLGALESLQIEAQDLGTGMFELKSATPAISQSAFVKQSGDWAFVAQNADVLAQVPADPVAQLDGLHQQYDVAVRLYVQNIPELFRQMAIGQMQAGLQQGLDELADQDQQDDDAQLQQKLAAAQLKALTRLVEETDHITVGWSIDSKQQQTHADFSLTALAGSQLAKQAAELSDTKSAFTGFLTDDGAVCLNFSSKYPQEDIQQMLAMLRTVRQQAMQAIDDEDLPGEKARAALKSSLGDFLDVVQATVEGGTMDGGMLLKLSPGSVTLAAGAHLVDAQRLEKVLKQIAELLAQEEPGMPAVQWDAEQHEGVRFHTLRVPVPEDEQDARKILGEAVDVAVGLGEHRFYVALGNDGLSVLKTAIDQSQAGIERTVPPAMFVLSVAKIVKFAALHIDDPTVIGLAEAFEQDTGADHVKITVTAFPNGFAYRLEVEQGALKALAQVLPKVFQQAAGAF